MMMRRSGQTKRSISLATRRKCWLKRRKVSWEGSEMKLTMKMMMMMMCLLGLTREAELQVVRGIVGVEVVVLQLSHWSLR